MANWWEEPALTGVGRLPMRPPLVDRAGSFFRSLDGRWRFSLAARPDAAPAGFETPDFDDGGWSEVDVPGCFTMQGYDRPIYTNIAMPFRTFPPDVPDANPTGCYRTTFVVPSDWRGRRVVIHIGAADSALRLWVNGAEVGISKDSRLEAEFDLTDVVRYGVSNVLAAQVVRWSDGSFLEDQDQWWQSGIHREVFLYSTPRTFLADVHANASLSGELDAGTLDLRVDVSFEEAARADGWVVRARCETERGDAVTHANSMRPCRAPRRVPLRRTHRSPPSRRARRRAVVSRDPEPLPAARGSRRSRRQRTRQREPLDRIPASRHSRARAPRERCGGAVAWRQPARLRPRHRTAS